LTWTIDDDDDGVSLVSLLAIDDGIDNGTAEALGR
jgi:hypothetical protein